MLAFLQTVSSAERVNATIYQRRHLGTIAMMVKADNWAVIPRLLFYNGMSSDQLRETRKQKSEEALVARVTCQVD